MLNATAFFYFNHLKYFLFSFNNRYIQNPIIKTVSNIQSKSNGFKVVFVKTEQILKKIATINPTKTPKIIDIMY